MDDAKFFKAKSTNCIIKTDKLIEVKNLLVNGELCFGYNYTLSCFFFKAKFVMEGYPVKQKSSSCF